KKTPEVPKVVASSWGWSKPDALPTGVAAADYMTKLAEAADEWFKQRPGDSRELAKRIGEFRQGCSQLLLAEHKSLPLDERVWLINRCKTWATKLDQHLADVEAGRPVAQVLDQTD